MRFAWKKFDLVPPNTALRFDIAQCRRGVAQASGNASQRCRRVSRNVAESADCLCGSRRKVFSRFCKAEFSLCFHPLDLLAFAYLVRVGFVALHTRKTRKTPNIEEALDPHPRGRQGKSTLLFSVAFLGFERYPSFEIIITPKLHHRCAAPGAL